MAQWRDGETLKFSVNCMVNKTLPADRFRAMLHF